MMRKSPVPKELREETALSLFRSALRLVRRERTLGRPAGALRIPKLSALDVVARNGGITVEGLAEVEGVREPTMSDTLDVLFDQDLVEPVTDPGDRRLVRVRLTERGRSQLSRDKRRLAGLLQRVSTEEIGALQTALKILERELGQERPQRKRAAAPQRRTPRASSAGAE
jgi:DNA-binding MarR family transcriptional regulator